MEEKVLYTLQPGSELYAENELRRTGLRFTLLPPLEPGVGVVQVADGFEALADAFRKKPPIFIRHICPAELTAAPDTQSLCRAVRKLAQRMDEELPYSVQLRLLAGTSATLRRGEVQAAMADAIAGVAPLDVRSPRQVISCALTPEVAYLGLSRVEDNLSAWAGGNCHFRLDTPISRAEGKLLEIFDLFRPTLPKEGRALDLGAAPGGWTKVLRDKGFAVTAVDPALLDPRVARDPGVTHVRALAQDFFKQQPQPFDLLVNDMRMDSRLSIQLTNSCAAWLNPGAYAVVTLKLPHANMQRNTAMAIRELARCYHVVAARQLFHNRSEVTLLAKVRREAARKG